MSARATASNRGVHGHAHPEKPWGRFHPDASKTLSKSAKSRCGNTGAFYASKAYPREQVKRVPVNVGRDRQQAPLLQARSGTLMDAPRFTHSKARTVISSDEEKQALLSRIETARRDCGCGFGGVFAWAALVVSVAGAWVVDWRKWSLLGYVGTTVMAVLGSATLGKLAGLARARWILHILLRRLARAEEPSTERLPTGGRG
jgi:hypothetical protein